MPDSALGYAMSAWDDRPQDQWYFGECLRALYRLERYGEMLELSPYVRGGGVCRYYLARAEEAMGTEPASRRYFEDVLRSEDDSAAADAASWLSILARDDICADSLLCLLRMAVGLRPGEAFYRARLVEELCEAGRLAEAWDNLRLLRQAGEGGQSYWSAWAAYAEAEGSAARELWALRRAWEDRRSPANARDLGWTLYIAGRDTMRAGHLNDALPLLQESAAMGCSSDVFAVKSDSLVNLIEEFLGR
jgi:tetratricopeptide (TPR) repeat protein